MNGLAGGEFFPAEIRPWLFKVGVGLPPSPNSESISVLGSLPFFTCASPASILFVTLLTSPRSSGDSSTGLALVWALGTTMCAQTYRVMTYFNGTTSAPPPPGVIAQSRSGYLVTTSDDEESSSVGEAFRVTTSGALTTLHLFSAAEPNRPFSGLILGRDGLFYGTTYYGGASNTGSIFTMTADGAVTTLHVFGKHGSGLLQL